MFGEEKLVAVAPTIADLDAADAVNPELVTLRIEATSLQSHVAMIGKKV